MTHESLAEPTRTFTTFYKGTIHRHVHVLSLPLNLEDLFLPSTVISDRDNVLVSFPATDAEFYEFSSWTVDGGAATDFDPSAISGDGIGQVLALRAQEHEMQLNQVAEFQTSEFQNVWNDHTGFMSASLMNLHNMLPHSRTLENNCPIISENREVGVSGSHTAVFYHQQEKRQKGQDSCGRELVLCILPDKCASHDQPCSSTIRKPRRSNSNSDRVFPGKMSAEQKFYLKRKRTPRDRSYDSNRRHKISERLKALQGLLPYSTGGFQASILDDVIKYVEYLQHQMKELSQCRLGSQPEPGTDPLFFLEGYNDHHVHGGTPEEFMADSIEFSPFAEINLLESRGLFVVPINIAEQLKRFAG